MEKFIWKDKVSWIDKYDNPFYLLEQIKEDDLKSSINDLKNRFN